MKKIILLALITICPQLMAASKCIVYKNERNKHYYSLFANTGMTQQFENFELCRRTGRTVQGYQCYCVVYEDYISSSEFKNEMKANRESVANSLNEQTRKQNEILLDGLQHISSIVSTGMSINHEDFIRNLKAQIEEIKNQLKK